MRAIFIMITIIGTLSFSSCEKKPKVTMISGVVLDYGTNEPIEGVKIHVKDGIDLSSPFTDADFTTDAEAIVYTDKEGKFNVEIEGEYSAALYPSKPSEYWNYDGGRTAVSDNVNGYANGSINEDEVIKLKAKAWFAGKLDSDIHVDSVKFKSVREYISISVMVRGKGPHKIITVSPGIPMIGNTYYLYQIEYKDTDGKWNNFIDSVYIKKGDVFTGTIKY